MTKTLQRKFIVTAMIAVTVLLLVLLGAINVFNVISSFRQSDELLEMLSRQEDFGPVPPLMGTGENGPHGFFQRRLNENDRMAALTFSVRFQGEELESVNTERIASLTEEEALEEISAVIKEHIHTAIDLPEPAMIRLVYWEQTYAPGGVTPILDTIRKYSEQFLAELLDVFWKDSGISSAESRIIGRLINGGIMSLAEHAVFLGDAGNRNDPEWIEWAKDTIYSFIITILF